MNTQDIAVCTQNDIWYPKSLLEIKKAPSKLFYMGDIGILNRCRGVAVIGTRKASSYGLEIARKIGQMAADSELIVINGLAIGCDTASLEGAISQNGKCVVVLPCGLDQIYPKSNYELAEKILEHGGCLISEYDQGITPQKNCFIDRDRIQSGLSNGIIIVESDETGGTMHTANFAQKQYRRIACYYSNLLEHMSGNKYLVESGKGEMLKKMEDVQVFMNRILNDEEYEQMTFGFK